MEKISEPDAVNAILAESASQRKSTQSKNSKGRVSSKSSSKRRTPKSQSSLNSTKPSSVRLSSSPNNRKGDTANADERLNQFMRGQRCIEVDGEEHYYDPEERRTYTLEEIGTVMGVTRERIRQIEEMALRKLWRAFDSMSRRENITPDEWMQILTDSHAGEDTVYIPS